jgi:hypothetical protein
MGLLLVVAGACATTGKSQGPSGQLQITGAGLHSDAKVTHDAILGPTMNLARSGGQLLGTAQQNRPVNVTLDAERQRANGVVGERPMQLVIEQRADGVTHGRGMIGGFLSDFEASPREISGRIARCSYQLSYDPQHGQYQGTQACGANLKPVQLQIPAVMQAWPALDRYSTLGIFLLGLG